MTQEEYLSVYPTRGLQNLQRAWSEASEIEREQFLNQLRREYLSRRRKKSTARSKAEGTLLPGCV